MKLSSAFLIAVFTFSSCDSPRHAKRETTSNYQASTEIPLLPVTKGDTWTYDVHLQIPDGITSPGAAEVDETFEQIRTYIGKIIPTLGLPQVDCFEVSVPGSPIEREFVEISDNTILMRGSMIMRPDTTQPMWLETPVPFVVSDVKVGTEISDIRTQGGALTRKIQIEAREIVKVPAGEFQTIRILMTGSDGELELRRTIWFSPGTGIIREQKTRLRDGKVIFSEEQKLSKIRMNSHKH